jgi:hypothetical protein
MGSMRETKYFDYKPESVSEPKSVDGDVVLLAFGLFVFVAFATVLVIREMAR